MAVNRDLSACSAVSAVNGMVPRRRWGRGFAIGRAARESRGAPRPTSCCRMPNPESRPVAVPRSRCCLFASSYAQRRMPNSPCQKPSNSSQNRSKRRRFPSKSDQKGAHFVMPILTFWVVTPSGASARAVSACRKGHFRCIWGSKMARGKVIHIFHKGGLMQRRQEKKRERGTGNRERGKRPRALPAPTLQPTLQSQVSSRTEGLSG